MSWFAGRRRDKRYDAPLAALRTATTLAFGPVGIAARTLPATQAYLDLAEAVDDGLRPALEELLGEATPAGRVYAAALLGRLDPAAGRAAWQRLAADRAELSTFQGCVGGRTTVARYATAQLDA
jgi:hypothetical protein